MGLIFDGNIESLPGDFIYLPEENRAVAVDVRGILEALEEIYGADRIVEELTTGGSRLGRRLDNSGMGCAPAWGRRPSLTSLTPSPPLSRIRSRFGNRIVIPFRRQHGGVG